MNKFFIACIVVISTIHCKQPDAISAQHIIDKAIAISGGTKIANSTIDFDFRTRHYKAIRNNGNYSYERVFQDSMHVIKDVLSNNGFQRYSNETPVTVGDSMVPRYSSSINSVHYFSVLPYGLNDTAVNKTYLKEVKIKGNNYHKIKITFNQEGGGEDFEDVFIYWIHTKTFKVHYIAYSYNESDGMGLRFREAYNERYVNDIRFVNYNNYKPKDNLVRLEDLAVLFEKDKLDLLSKIELKNIRVN